MIIFVKLYPLLVFLKLNICILAMRKAILLLIFLIPQIVDAQIKNIGVPSIVNHSRITYNASTQNWSITQCSKGFIYFGNNDGILEFDGTSWRLFQVPNESVVRSVYAVGDTIFSGAFEEIGYLAPDKSGRVEYHSLNHLIPPGYSYFGEVWNIFKDRDKVYFQSFINIFVLHKGRISVIEPISKFSMLHKVNESFYIVDIETGLMKLSNDSLELVSSHPIFFRNEIRSIIQFDNGDFLVGTSNEGFFIMKRGSGTIIPWNSEVNKHVKESSLFSAIKLSSGYFAIGSISNGIYISNQEGVIYQHLNRYKGLQNNTILSVFEDRRNNIWLGLDNGIDFLETSSPLTFLNYNFNIESAYTSIVHNGIFYIGTNQGLFAKEYCKIETLNSHSEGFYLIKGTEGQVWSLEVIDNTIFCGHNFGCFIIDGFKATQISDIRGFWSFIKINGNHNIILAGTYTGLVRLIRIGSTWKFLSEINGFEESSRSMFFDNHRNLWISHGYRGLFRVNLTEELDSVTSVRLYKGEFGLPQQLPYNIQVLNNEMYISTHSGVLRYNSSNESFSSAFEVNKLFANKGFIDKLQQDRSGNIWYFTNNYMGILRLLEDGTYIDITSPFSNVNEILLPAFQNIFIYDPINIFIGSQKGLIHYAPNIIKDYSTSDRVFIKETVFYGKEKPFEFYLPLHRLTSRDRVIPYSNNSVTFRFTSPSFERPDRVEFSYRLLGFDSSWSDWDVINFKDYTNLKEGKYEFQVKALNSFGAETAISKFPFSIKPPMLRSRAAYISYLVVFVLIVSGNFYYLRRRIIKARMREKLRHEKRLAQREKVFLEQSALSEKEIVQLRNESLKNEMKFKNKELANATLHLIQKNKTLTYLREDLTRLLKNIPVDSSEKHNVNSLLKKINRDLRNEKNWELFNSYFDEVHQDFITRLKEQYKDLSPKELRLCAYLRMNISTKEIAPLMNISVRGVEISRYRLRKKLKLDYNTNLTDFLISY